MAVKTLKKCFSIFFIINRSEFFFVDCWSVLVLTGSLFISTATKNNLVSSYTFYILVLKLKNFRVPFLIFWIFLKSYHVLLILIVPIGLRKSFKRSYIKLSEKNLWFKLLGHFLLALFYWIFGCCLSLLLFSSSITYCKALLTKYNWQTILLSPGGII